MNAGLALRNAWDGPSTASAERQNLVNADFPFPIGVRRVLADYTLTENHYEPDSWLLDGNELNASEVG
jgi:hypothetical protein